MLEPGTRLGQYEIRSLIGAGGMGEVYLAHDPRLQRPVALKVLAGTLRLDAERRTHLQQEARAASALNHPNILTVYEIGNVGETHFIAAEYVDGMTLRQRIGTLSAPALREVVDVMLQIASALSAAEGAGLVHRDVKPDNIMVRRDGWVKLLDFGLARSGPAVMHDPAHPSPDVVRGTVFYMSPEQLRGLPVDHRSDIWSAGVVLYEMISGRLPFDAASPAEVARRIINDDPDPLTLAGGAPVPPRVAAIVARAMVKDRAARYQSADRMVADLRELRWDLENDAAAVAGTSEARMADTEPVAVQEPPASNLPRQLTDLVGRDAERDDVVSLLRRPEVRLVTLTGPGGTGKTRLGVAAGTELLNDFAHGVWWVALESIRDARLVLPQVAAVLEVNEGSTDPADALRNALAQRSVLLVMDNFEQVLDAAPLLAELLRSAPGVKALVTSRSPLRIAGEREYAVPPLTTPPIDLPLSTDALLAYPSVALFVARANAVQPDFVLTARNGRAVAELCVRLDGLPLAIELAAARVNVLPPTAMLARIDERLKLLTGGMRDLPARQQTMRAAISWGYNLLDDDERRLFSMLAVFRGGFTLQSAERLCHTACARASARGADLGRPPEIVEGISSLLEKAFLRRDPASPEDAPRFSMLETIREYGLECLANQPFGPEIRASHAELMASLAEENESNPAALDGDGDNFRTAIDHACNTGDARLALRLGAALWWHWYVRGHYHEGRRALDAILAVPGGERAAARAKAATGAGALAFLQCDYARAISLLEESIDLARAHGDNVSLARALQFRGSIARERGEYEHAVDLHHLSRTIWTGLGDDMNAARSLNAIALASWLSGDLAHAAELSSSTLPLFRDRRDTEGVAWSLLNSAACAVYSGEIDRAGELLEECLSWSRTGGFKEGLAWSLNLLGVALRARGETERPRRFLRDSLQLDWELGDRWRAASVLEALGGLLRDGRLIVAASAIREQLGAPVPPVERPQLDSDLAAIGELPSEDVSIEQAVRIALA